MVQVQQRGPLLSAYDMTQPVGDHPGDWEDDLEDDLDDEIEQYYFSSAAGEQEAGRWAVCVGVQPHASVEKSLNAA